MPGLPLLRLSLDFVSLPAALAVALRIASAVDVLEIGTPLCKSVGLDAIRAVREVCPDKLIFADFKTPDVGALEAQMAFDAGADFMTVIGGAPLITVEQALNEAHKRGKHIFVELTGVRDILDRAREWQLLGVEWLVYHRGWDKGLYHRKWTENDLAIIETLIAMDFKVAIAGGITVEQLPFFSRLLVSLLITGRAIHQAADPPAAAMEMRSEIARLWGTA
jgi:3-dehydro-L-gulonate-6-phosphate decarboxylase